MILNIHIEHNALKDAASSQVGYISPAGEKIYITLQIIAR